MNHRGYSKEDATHSHSGAKNRDLIGSPSHELSISQSDNGPHQGDPATSSFGNLRNRHVNDVE